MQLNNLMEDNDLPLLIMFDLDGTLIDSALDLHNSINATLEALGDGPITLEDIRNFIGNGMRHLLMRSVAKSRKIPEESVSAATMDSYMETCRQMYAKYNFKDTKLYTGVEESLQQLSHLGVKKAIVTNKPKPFVPPILDGLNISQHFEFVIGGECLPQKKPHPLPLQHTMKRFNTLPEHSLMVGDSQHDIVAGNAASVKTCAVNYGYNHGECISRSKPSLIVSDLRELFSDG